MALTKMPRVAKRLWWSLSRHDRRELLRFGRVIRSTVLVPGPPGYRYECSLKISGD